MTRTSGPSAEEIEMAVELSKHGPLPPKGEKYSADVIKVNGHSRKHVNGKPITGHESWNHVGPEHGTEVARYWVRHAAEKKVEELQAQGIEAWWEESVLDKPNVSSNLAEAAKQGNSK